MYQVSPFFNESVCYKLPGQQGPPPAASQPAAVTPGHKKKPSAQEQAWQENLYSMLTLTSSPELDKWKKHGTKKIDGKSCTVWLDPEGTGCQQTVCFDEDGNVISSFFKQMSDSKDGFWTQITLKDFRPATAKELTLPTGCVDLLNPTTTVDLQACLGLILMT